jgi:uncharacterized membrane protein YeaQ/YmgE (transglycosylase-associated protein family)
MTILQLLLLLAVAGVCGAVGQAIAGYSRGGCIASIALGFIGALLGPWIAHQAGLPEWLTVQVGATRFPVVWSIVGSTLFVAIVSFFSRSRS